MFDISNVFIGVGMRVVFHEDDRRQAPHAYHGHAGGALDILQKIVKNGEEWINFVAKFHHESEWLRRSVDSDYSDHFSASHRLALDSYHRTAVIFYHRPTYYSGYKRLGPYAVLRQYNGRGNPVDGAGATVIESWRDVYLDNLEVYFISRRVRDWPKWIINPPSVEEMAEIAHRYRVNDDELRSWPEGDTLADRRLAVIIALERAGRAMRKHLPTLTAEEAAASDPKTLRIDNTALFYASCLRKNGWSKGDVYKLFSEAEAAAKIYKPHANCIDGLCLQHALSQHVIHEIERASCGARLTERARAALGERNPQRSKVFNEIDIYCVDRQIFSKIGLKARGTEEITLEALHNIYREIVEEEK